MIGSRLVGQKSFNIKTKQSTIISSSEIGGGKVSIIAGAEIVINEGSKISAQESLHIVSDTRIDIAEGVTITFRGKMLQFVYDHCLKSINSTADGGLDCVSMSGEHILFTMAEDCWY